MIAVKAVSIAVLMALVLVVPEQHMSKRKRRRLQKLKQAVNRGDQGAVLPQVVPDPPIGQYVGVDHFTNTERFVYF